MTTEGDLPTTPRRHIDWRTLPWAPIGVATAGVATIALTSILLYPVVVPSAADGPLNAAPDSRRSAGMAGLPGTASSAPASPSAPVSGSASASPRATPKSVVRSGKPAAGNTGVIAGTQLAVVTGDQTYGTDNQVVENADIRGYVRITGKKVTIRNSLVRGGAATRCGAVIQVEPGASAVIEDVEVVPQAPGACLDGVWANATNLTRVNIHGTVNGVKATGNDVVVQDSWVHGLVRYADGAVGGEGTINDAVEAFGKRRITLRHNVLDAGSGNAAFQVTQEGGASGDLRVEGNWLDGGACTLNFAHRGGGAPTLTGIAVVNNRFGRGSKFVCPVLVSTQTTLGQNSGNVWDDTGAPIPAPDRHD